MVRFKTAVGENRLVEEKENTTDEITAADDAG
jgi:hypothetical protein